MTREQELAIVSDVLSGNTDAFEALVSENEKKVYVIAYRMTNSPEDAADITQDTFLKAYKNLGSYQGDCSFGTWLCAIAANCCRDFIRRNAKTVTEPLYSINEAGEEIPVEIADEKNLPEKILLDGLTMEAVRRGLNILTPEFRMPLILREIQGLSYREICTALSLDEGTVKSRISRARKKLCAYLLKDGNIPGFLASKYSGGDGNA